MLNGLRHGHGMMVWHTSNGEAKGGLQEGYAGSSYNGEFRLDKMKGNGTFTFPDGGSYEGKMKDDMMHGYGRREFANGVKFKGQFRHDKRFGKGVYFTQGRWAMTLWKDDVKIGPSVYHTARISELQGLA
jgi:hypothetical protein